MRTVGSVHNQDAREVSEKVVRRERFGFIRKLFRDRMVAVAMAILLILVALSLWPVAKLPHNPYNTDLRSRLEAPFSQGVRASAHILGTDNLGRDLLSRLMIGTRTSLGIALLATLVSAGLGVSLGTLGGFLGGWFDSVVMRLVDIQLAFPVILLVIAVIAVIGPSLTVLVVLLGLSGWPSYARLVRAEVLQTKELEFIEAARAIGSRQLRLVVKHVLPNVMGTIAVFGSFEVARIILLESAVSFLGLGVQPPNPSLGTMIADGQEYLYGGWWISAIPGIIISIAVLSFNFLGDGLRDAVDPKSA